MGYYIETEAHKNKAKWLIENAKAQLCNRSAVGTSDMVPVVVMDNGAFEAAGIAFDAEELAVFTDANDRRPRMYLLVPREEVIRLCPHVEPLLDW